MLSIIEIYGNKGVINHAPTAFVGVRFIEPEIKKGVINHAPTVFVGVRFIEPGYKDNISTYYRNVMYF